MIRKMFILPFLVFLFWSSNAMDNTNINIFNSSSGVRTVRVLPTVDIAFKKVFGEERNKSVLIHFLNSILRRTTDPIVDLKFANTEISPETLSDKLSRLDVLVQTSKKEIINIEIQVKDAGNMVDRSTYYASRLIATSLSSGQPYNALPKFIMINLLGYNTFRDERCHRIIALSDVETHARYSDMLEIHFFELQKYKPSVSSLEEAWILFLKDPNSELFLKPETPKEFAIAKKTLLMLEGNEEFVSQYMQREKDMRDQLSAVLTAEQKAILSEKTETARKMIAASFPTEQIMMFTGLTKEQVDSLR
jgi:predicted transposase/invertase (TIGR01784 family)